MIKHCINKDGYYVGGFHRDIPGHTQVPSRPDDGRQKWNGTAYDPLPEDPDAEDRAALADSEAQATILVELYKNLVNENGPIDPANMDSKASESFQKLKTAIDRKGSQKRN